MFRQHIRESVLVGLTAVVTSGMMDTHVCSGEVERIEVDVIRERRHPSCRINAD